jgi:uncharacterized repeat protein (TIGR01451 family)
MAVLRSELFAVAVAILTSGLAHAGNPPMMCSASVSVPTTLRAESVSELIGDIVLTCTVGIADQYAIGVPLPIANITVSLPVNVTSRLINGSVSEALLLIDDPGSGLTAPVPGTGPQAPQTVCSSASLGAAAGGCPQYPVMVGNIPVMSSSPTALTNPANIYQGNWFSYAPNQIQFLGVPILPPLNSGGTRTYRITNVRSNMPAPIAYGVTGQQLNASVSISSTTSITLNDPFQTAGFIQPSLSVATQNLANTGPLTPPAFATCANQPVAVTPAAVLQFSENFPTAWKTRVAAGANYNAPGEFTSGSAYAQNIPGTIYNSESGFILNTPNGTAGLADYGTRLKAVFHGVPTGVRMFVSVSNVANNPTAAGAATLVSGEAVSDSSSVATFPASPATTTVGGIPAAELAVDSTGTAEAVWETIANNPTAIDQYNFVVYVLYTYGSATGSATVNLGYAPTLLPGADPPLLLAWGTASDAFTLPRFSDSSGAQNLFSVVPCVTGPELTVTKTHPGSFSQGDTGDTYAITVTNSGLGSSSGAVTVVDILPNGLTATAMAGAGWACALSSLTCTRSDPLNPGASYSPIAVTVNVGINVASPLTNQVIVSGGGSAGATAIDATRINGGLPPGAVTLLTPAPGASVVPPTTSLTWTPAVGATSYNVYLGNSPLPAMMANTTGTSYTPATLNPYTTYFWSVSAVNAFGSTASAVSPFSTVGPILTVTKMHSGSFAQGDSGDPYTITVTNSVFSTSGAVTVEDILPNGLAATAMAGTGWTCTLSTLRCTRSDVLNPGASYPPVTVTVKVASNAPSLVTNQAYVMVAGSDAGASDTTTIAARQSACSFTLTPAYAYVPATGTSTVEVCPNSSGQPSCGFSPETPQTFTVTPSGTCGAWTATSSDPGVVQITSGASGSGVGTVGFTVLNNTHTVNQFATITVASGAASAFYSVTEYGSGDSQTYRETYALYEQLLGRDPDPAGFAFWTGPGGAGLGQMADSFFTSPEAFNSDFAVMAAYQAATGAPPSYAQFTAVIASVRAGAQTVPGLFNSLIGSSFTAATLYQNLLNRAPTGADSACISTGLGACFQSIVGYPSSTTPVGALDNEFQSTGIYQTTLAADHTNALYLQMLYYTILGRDPDAAGFTFWLGITNSGGPGILFQGSAGYPTRIQILGPGTPNQGFIGSPEFQSLFAN